MDSISSHSDPAEPIAIIGMACRLPGSINSPSSLWETLLSKRSTYTPVPPSRFTHASFHHPDGSRAGSLNIPGGNFINSSLAAFDAGFFGISPVDAYVMDPQQRILLEVAYECLESAGVPVESIRGQNVGVYVGAWTADYENIQTKDPNSKEVEASWITGTGRAILSNRVSYVFDLKGPSMTIDTGCSASAMALHVACQALRAPSSRTHSALVGGTNLMINPEMPISMTKLGILSSTGGCTTFDERANGYSRADGINCLYLKRLSDALRDLDPIRAVIRASAVNSDGKTMGLAAPSPTSQEAAIRDAYASAGISDFTQTAYFECHGTATKVGDPIEASAIAKVFGRAREVEDPLYVGAVKTNIGHSGASSALSAVIKAVLAVEAGIIPPNVGFEKPNPKINFKAWKLKVPTEALPWPRSRIVRRASVGAFGYGGANAHFIIDDIESYLNSSTVPPEQHQPALHRKCFLHLNEAIETSTAVNRPYLLTFSAKTASGVKKYVDTLTTAIAADPVLEAKPNLADLAYTLGKRRSLLPIKAFGVFSGATKSHFVGELKAFSENLECIPEAMEERRIGFVFTGQGAQWARMGVELITVFPLVGRTLEKLSAHLKTLKVAPGWDIIEELKKSREESNVNEPQFSQVLCTAIQICLVKLLRSWNIHPRAVVGHSSGEIAAAYASGSLTSSQAITVAYYRGIICSLAIETPGFPKGGMLAVGLDEGAMGQFLEPFKGRIGVACVNSANSVTISGDLDALELLEGKLNSPVSPDAESVFFRRLQVPLAYHSHHMGLLGPLYEAQLSTLTPKVGSCPMYSSVTGGMLDGRKLGARYWRQNLESTVLFSNAVKAMVVDGASVNTLIEIGPHSTLASPLRDIRAAIGLPVEALVYSPTLIRRKDASHAVIQVAGKLFAHGYRALDLEKVNGIEDYQSRRVLVDLPSYVWDHSQEYWLECRRSREWRFRRHPRHDILGSRVPGIDPSEPQWMNVLGIRNAPWIQDHVIRGNVVFPAAGYICMAIEALTQFLESSDQFDSQHAFLLREITIQKPLVLGNERSRSQKPEGPIQGTEVFLTLRSEQSNTMDASRWYRFNIRTTSASGKENVKHCSGLITMENRRETRGPPEIVGQHVRKIDCTQFYEAMNEVGFNYGQTFSGLKSLRARTHKPEMWATMNNFMERNNTSESSNRTQDTKGEVLVANNGFDKEDSDEEAATIRTPSTSRSSGAVTPIRGTSQSAPSLSSSNSERNSEGMGAASPQLEHTLPEGLDIATQSAAIETLQRLQMSRNANDHIDSRYVIHPVNLDLTLQLLFGTIHSGKISAITDIMVPVSIEEVYIAMPSPETTVFTMHAVAERMSDSAAYDSSGQEVIRVRNIETRELGHMVSRSGGQRDPNLMRLNWVVDFDAINQGNYRKALNTVHEVLELPQSPEGTHDLSYMIKLMTAEMIDMTDGLTPTKPHFEKYRSWLLGHHRGHSEKQDGSLYGGSDVNASTLTPIARRTEIERLLSRSGVRGELVYTVYSNILPLFRGEVDDNELFQKDDLWTRFNAAEGVMQYVTSLSNLYSTKYSRASILEISAGTGYGTQAILEGCTRNAGTPSVERQYQSYTFTDSNSELVAEGKDLFGTGYPGMDFCTLDIERDPELQGYERKYDLVYAVLHNTKNIRESVRNIAKLLRVGGRVLITDLISPKSEAVMGYVPFAFGISESWWRDEAEYRSRIPLISIEHWVRLLEMAGFRVDFTISDARLSIVYACLVGTYIGEPKVLIKPSLKAPQPSTGSGERNVVPSTAFQPSTPNSVILLFRHSLTPTIEQLQQKLVSSLKKHQIIPMSFESLVFGLPDSASFVLSLLELDQPLLADITPLEFEKFKQLISTPVPCKIQGYEWKNGGNRRGKVF